MYNFAKKWLSDVQRNSFVGSNGRMSTDRKKAEHLVQPTDEKSASASVCMNNVTTAGDSGQRSCHRENACLQSIEDLGRCSLRRFEDNNKISHGV